MTSSSSTSSRRVVLAFLTLLIVVSILVLFVPQLTFALGLSFVLAYLLNPIVGFLYRQKLGRSFSSLLVVVVWFSLAIAFFVVLVPVLFEQVKIFSEKLPMIAEKLQELLKRLPYAEMWVPDLKDTEALKSFSSSAQGVVGIVLSRTVHVFARVIGFLIIPLLTFYLLKDFPKMLKQLLKRVPHSYQPACLEISGRLELVLGGVLRGQALVCAILSVYYAIALSIVGVDLGLFLGLVTGFLNIIPIVGILSSLALSGLFLAIHDAHLSQYVGLGAVYLLGIGLESGFLTPKILSNKTELNPAIILLALMAGSELFGLMGMVLAVPAAAVLKVFFDFLLAHLNEI